MDTQEPRTPRVNTMRRVLANERLNAPQELVASHSTRSRESTRRAAASDAASSAGAACHSASDDGKTVNGASTKAERANSARANARESAESALRRA